MRKSIEDHLAEWINTRPQLHEKERYLWIKIQDLILKQNYPPHEVAASLKKLQFQATKDDIAQLLNSPLIMPPQEHYFPIWEAIGFCHLSSRKVEVKLAAVPTVEPKLTTHVLVFSYGFAPGYLLVGEFQGRPIVRLIVQTDYEIDEQFEKQNVGRVRNGYTPVRRLETDKKWKMVIPVTR